MPSVAEEHPRLMAPGRKRRRDVNDSSNDWQLQGPLYEKLAQYHSAAAVATNNWNADGMFGSRPVQQQIQQQQQQQQQNFFSRFPGSSNDRMIFQYGFPDSTNTTTEDSHQNLDPVSRKIAPLPVPKRQRMFDEEGADLDRTDGEDLSTHPSSQRQRRNSKSPPASQHNSPTRQDQTGAAGNRPKTPSSLSPCHICHRRPTKKSDLDSFADCQGCGQRSCFVCIRECHGWRKDGRPSTSGGSDLAHAEQQPERGNTDLSRSCQMDDVDDDRQRQSREGGESKQNGQSTSEDGWTGGGHRQMVCSRCCIEKGAEGDVVCLGCLSRMESV
ncbi:hypothetical protein LY78DRAFT_650106 [Colletotrichum sublineola]|uniref:Uncharacterized protein n=1 Tax=Colletotrichum sublineola TaxID=1173701 RepID=A0A066X7W5_COLSU|nr:hypothetical protein LY78DRAFT_650106 [Colletotrichum sublineola]KDN61841.1 hypothetical protein CSUB01_00386 [Colletotrichum sublineola]